MSQLWLLRISLFLSMDPSLRAETYHANFLTGAAADLTAVLSDAPTAPSFVVRALERKWNTSLDKMFYDDVMKVPGRYQTDSRQITHEQSSIFLYSIAMYS
jgi:hypothetical protein